VVRIRGLSPLTFYVLVVDLRGVFGSTRGLSALELLLLVLMAVASVVLSLRLGTSSVIDKSDLFVLKLDQNWLVNHYVLVHMSNTFLSPTGGVALVVIKLA
jgi:hypothetical protein